MIITVPEKVRHILDVLERAGYEAYAVGGCVRDAILGRKPEDWDITTIASPRQVKALFPHCIDTGIQHGTVTIMLGRDGFEVTTYRIDGAYQDGRHPEQVFYTTELREDLRRRDFTMNAMAYHPDRGLVDIFGGQEDMETHVVRCVGNPVERFTEDALRILRAIRFSAQLGFTIEAQTLEALRQLAPNLRYVSKERIQVELIKMLVSPHPDQIQLMYDTGIMAVILPQLCPVLEAGGGARLEAALRAVPAKKNLRLAVLLSSQSTQTKKILKDLKFDNDTMQAVTTLVRWQDYELDGTPVGVRKLLRGMGDTLFEDLMELKDALTKAAGESYDTAAEVTISPQKIFAEEALAQTAVAREQYQKILEAGQCYSLKALAVSGKDLLAAGCAQGKMLGETLEKLLTLVIEHPEKNERDVLLAEAQKILSR